MAAAGKTGAGQPLSSTGSCLEQFRPQPFLECQGARGTCAFFSDKFSFWLTTVEPTKEFEVPETKVLNSNKGDELTNQVSRCKVCQRAASSSKRTRSSGGVANNGGSNNGGVVQPDSVIDRPKTNPKANGNEPESTLFGRMARSIRNWF